MKENILKFITESHQSRHDFITDKHLHEIGFEISTSFFPQGRIKRQDFGILSEVQDVEGHERSRCTRR